jgi:hypothetical protein
MTGWRIVPLAVLLVALAGCSPKGVVNSGTLVLVEAERLCIEGPDGDRTCFARDEDTIIPPDVEVGDMVSVRVVEGVVDEVTEIGGPTET